MPDKSFLVRKQNSHVFRLELANSQHFKRAEKAMSAAVISDQLFPARAASEVFKIFAVDDDPLDLWMLQQFSEEAINPRCEMMEFSTIAAVLAAVKVSTPNLVILDDNIDGALSADTGIAALRANGYMGAIAVVSGFWRPGRRQSLVQRGAFAFLDKEDLTPTAFMGLVDMAIAAETYLKLPRANIVIR